VRVQAEPNAGVPQQGSRTDDVEVRRRDPRHDDLLQVADESPDLPVDVGGRRVIH
jgi:hypothetical protein